MKYYYFKDHHGEWRWFLKAANDRIIAASGSGYEDEQECLYDIELVKASLVCRVAKQSSAAAGLKPNNNSANVRENL
jgi:uncharacterized protein YegP (UPF0339 family)